MNNSTTFANRLSSKITRRRTILLAGAGALSLALASQAQAQVRVHLEEGQPTLPGDVNLSSGNDELYINVLRANADGSLNLGVLGSNSALAIGVVNNNGGDDRLWLVSDGTQAVNLLDPPPGSDIANFTGGVGYYAKAGADLTLNPSSQGAWYKKTLYLSGEDDSTITLTGRVQLTSGETAVKIFHPFVGAGGDVIVQAWIDGARMTGTTPLVDAREAHRFVLGANGKITLIEGVGLFVAADGETVIEDGGTISAVDPTFRAGETAHAILVDATVGGTVRNFGEIIEAGDPGSAGQETEDTISLGVLLNSNATLYNERTSATRFGKIAMHGNAVQMEGDGGNIVNSGLIQSDMSAAISTIGAGNWGISTTRNLAQGIIQGVNEAQTSQFVTAYLGGAGTDIVVNSGTINGAVVLGGGSDAFLAVGDANGNPTGTVSGVIDGGDGRYDAYGMSFDVTGRTYTASNGILSGTPNLFNFERHGLEANGAAVTAMFNAAETLNAGLSIYGTGRVINRADISVTNATGIYVDEGASGMALINDADATITAQNDYALYAGGDALVSFVNRGSLASTGSMAVAISARLDGGSFAFDNSGTTTSDSELAVYLYVDGVTDAGAGANVINSGTITGSEGIDVQADEGVIDFTNTNTGLVRGLDNAVTLRGNRIDAANAGMIESQGGRYALLLKSSQTLLTNSGSILATGAGVAGDLAAAVAVDLNTGGGAEIVNEAGGRIEAPAANSTAMAVVGTPTAEFKLTNRGTILGSGNNSPLNGGQVGGLNMPGVAVAASAIQTYRTIDTIINDGNGLIRGDVDLGAGNDRFEANGASRLEGDLILGAGDDTFRLSSGTVTGKVIGGDPGDTLLIDLSGDREIDADKYIGFGNILRDETTANTGILTAKGHFNVVSLQLAGMRLRVAEGTTLETDADAEIGELAVQGSDGEERLILAGRLNGNVDLGGGDDVLELTDTGMIDGTISGGAGTDTIAYNLTDDGTFSSAMIDAADFEILGVDAANNDYTLTLASGGFDSVSLTRGANLIVEASAGTIGTITGDESDNKVEIRGQLSGGVSLGAGNDELLLGDVSGTISGALDGGLGTDGLTLNLTGETTFGNGAKGFETITVTGSERLIMGGDFAAGQTLNFGDDDNNFVIASGTTFAGTVDGAGGTDTLTVNANAGATTTISGAVLNFETMNTAGGGTTALTGNAYSFQTVTVADGGSLALGAGTTLSAAGGVTFTGEFDNQLKLGLGAKVNGSVDGGNGTDTVVFNVLSGQVGRFSEFDLGNLFNFETLGVSGSGEFHIDRNIDGFNRVDVDGGTLIIDSGSTLSASINGNFNKDIGDTVKIFGTVQGPIGLWGGDDTVDNSGRIEGDVLLGDGNDRYIARGTGIVTGTINGGTGDNTFIFNINGNPNASIPGNVVNFNSFGVYGPGTLEIALNQGQNYARLELLEGANLTLADNGGTVGMIIGDDSAQIVTIGSALTQGVELNGGDDTLNLDLAGVLSGTLDGGAGSDTMNIALTGASTINRAVNFEAINVAGTAALTIAQELGANQVLTFTGTDDNHLIVDAGAVLAGTVDGGAGTDTLTINTNAPDSRTIVAGQVRNFDLLEANGTGTLALSGAAYDFNSVSVDGGNLALGTNTMLNTQTGVTFAAGTDNRLTLASGAGIEGTIDAGDGNDTLALEQAQGTTRRLGDLEGFGTFERLESVGAGALVIDADAAFAGGVSVDGGSIRVTAETTLTANVTGGANADTVEVLGHLDGDVSLGDGNDRLVITSLDSLTGLGSGGAGVDTIDFRTAGTYEAPVEFNGLGFDSFESMDVSAGVVSLVADTAWADLNVTGGRLIGQAGTTITSAGTIDVAAGATFGSAGIVNGDINVLGTLSPGASPGTMTVNGDVTLAAGSHLLIELTPAAGTDLLDVNGTLNIANGAAIDITGALDGLPGNVLDIVTANAITGRFTTINKSSTVFGFVVQNGNRIQIRSEFQAGDDLPTNAAAGVAYANQVLREGYGVQAFTGALNVLTAADGTVNARAFQQLTPEAYGSALQANIENALQVTDSVRMLKVTAPARNGLYGFAQGLIGGGDIDGQADTGASRADLRTTGFFGGIGYGMGEGRMQTGAFLGRTDTNQKLSHLGATTDSTGWLAGVYADAAFGAVGVHGLVAYSYADADTTRNLMVSSDAAKGDYSLKSWVADVSVDYRVEMEGMAITPKVGVTYVNAKRNRVTEEGAGDFGLVVGAGSKDAWFGDAGVTVSGTFGVEGMLFQPYAELGVRQRLNDSDILVTGAFDGAPGAPVTVNGVERDKTAVRVGVGFGLDLTERARFHAGYTGEFGGTERSNFTAGVSVRF